MKSVATQQLVVSHTSLGRARTGLLVARVGEATDLPLALQAAINYHDEARVTDALAFCDSMLVSSARTNSPAWNLVYE